MKVQLAPPETTVSDVVVDIVVVFFSVFVAVHIGFIYGQLVNKSFIGTS